MTYRTITTYCGEADTLRSSFESAIRLARNFGAHLSVIAPGIDRTDPGYYYAGAQAVVLRETFDEASQRAQALSTLVSQRLAGETIAWDIDDRVVQSVALRDHVAERVRYSDLVVMPRPYGEIGTSDDLVALEAALFAARVPVLVVPEDAPEKDPTTVLVAWNDSDEAMRAARGAMPFLTAAARTDVTIVDPPRHGAGRSDPGGALACYLNRHGAKAEITILARSEPDLADILMRRARETGAGLIVMGAYGHTRMREAIFGGVTRGILERTDIPVLMAH